MTRARKTASSSAILVPSSSSSSLKSLKEEKPQKTGKKLSLPIPKNKDQKRKSEESGMEIEGESSKSENVEKVTKSPEILTEDRNFSTPARGVKSGPLPSTGITPIAQRLQISPRPEIPAEPVTEPPSDEIEIDLKAQETSIIEEILGSKFNSQIIMIYIYIVFFWANPMLNKIFRTQFALLETAIRGIRAKTSDG